MNQPDFRGADLSSSEISDSGFLRALLVGADLSQASVVQNDLSEADLRDVPLVGTALIRNDFTNASLLGAVGIPRIVVENIWSNTDLPRFLQQRQQRRHLRRALRPLSRELLLNRPQGPAGDLELRIPASITGRPRLRRDATLPATEPAP